MIRRHGKDQTFDRLGYNSRMYVLNARIIEQRMKHIESNQLKRQDIARQYDAAFADLPIKTQKVSNGLNHNYHKYVVRFVDKDTRKRVKNALNASIHYENTLSANGMYDFVSYRTDNCKASKTASNTILSLPIHPWLTSEEIKLVIKTIGDNL